MAFFSLVTKRTECGERAKGTQLLFLARVAARRASLGARFCVQGAILRNQVAVRPHVADLPELEMVSLKIKPSQRNPDKSAPSKQTPKTKSQKPKPKTKTQNPSPTQNQNRLEKFAGTNDFQGKGLRGRRRKLEKASLETGMPMARTGIFWRVR